ncbi:hypothetical protein D3C86_1886390 [compost metagenome]
MQLALGGDVGQRGVRKDQLARGKGRAQVLGRGNAGAEEGQLETQQPATGLYLAGDVPPLGAEIGVAAEVTREHQGARWQGAGGGWQGQHTDAGRGLGQPAAAGVKKRRAWSRHGVCDCNA